MIARYLLAVALGVCGSIIAVLLQLPIPWLLGSLFVCALGTWLGLPISALPKTIERWMRVAIGVSLGPAVAKSITGFGTTLPYAIVAAILITTVTVVAGTRWFELKIKLPRPSAFLASLPGGLSMLLAMAGDIDNRSQIVLAHAVRVVLVVVSISLLARVLGVPPVADPFGAGFEWSNDTSILLLGGLIVGCFVLAERVHIAGGHVIFPMIITALIAGFTDISLDPPTIVKTVAMLVFGIVIGTEVAAGPRGSYSRVAGASVSFTVAIMTLGTLSALVLTQVVDQSFLVLFLALAPGGIAEVSLIALALGLDAGTVALVHSCRFMYIILVGPIGLQFLTKRERIEANRHSKKAD